MNSSNNYYKKYLKYKSKYLNQKGGVSVLLKNPLLMFIRSMIGNNLDDK